MVASVMPECDIVTQPDGERHRSCRRNRGPTAAPGQSCQGLVYWMRGEVRTMGKQTEVAVSDRLSLTAKPTARIVRNLAMTPAAEEFLGDLARRTGLSEGEVLRLALGMFKTAV